MSDHVGCRTIDLLDPVQQVRIPLSLLYPTGAPASAERFGPYSLELARDGEVAGDGLPLVVISHGNGGSPWVYRGLAAHLARAGHAVAMVEHIGNSRSDNSLAGTVANLENRPRHVRLAIDAALADAHVGPRLDAGRVAIVGHSIGAYTALATAGGRAMTLPGDAGGGPFPVETARDRRIRAVVLLAPAIDWFGADGALVEVDVPILVRTGERDPLCPSQRVLWTLRSVPDPARIDHVDVAGAGHFSFSSPFPPTMTRPDFPPSQDPPGFDRAAYQAVLQDEVVAFLRAALGSPRH
jgi:predicted dienelactone hydrolase